MESTDKKGIGTGKKLEELKVWTSRNCSKRSKIGTNIKGKATRYYQ